MRQPRLKDVAEAAGVHVATASRALNDRTAGMISPETVARVRSAALSLGYRVNGMARALKTRRSFAIGMLLPDITNPFFPPIVRGAEDALSAAGFTLVLGNTDNEEEPARRHLTGMLERQVDGIMIASARRDDPVVEQLRDAGVSTVLVNRITQRGGVSSIIPDERVGILLAVEHLQRLGHQRIGHVGGPRNTSSGAQRAQAFADALGDAYRPDLVVHADRFTEQEGHQVATSLLDRSDPPTAIVAANDLLAIGVLDALGDLGRSCPRDLSVVGFNDMPLVDHIRPPLTTVRVPGYEMGRRAAEMLLAHIEHPDRPAETVLLATNLVIRASTAPPTSRNGPTTGS
jgi:LacI family transcriptional regulator